MIAYARKAIRRLINPVLVAKARTDLSRLDATHAASQLLRDAVDSALASSATPHEQAWTNKIESLRASVLACTREVDLTDFGAVDAGLDLTAEQMYQGKTVRRRVCDICRTASKPKRLALILFKLLRSFQPACALELGTCLGISGSYQAAAMKLNGFGKLVTLEGAEALASIARQNFESLGLDNVHVVTGRFQDTLPSVLSESAPFGYAFIDGHHDEHATLDYFERIAPSLTERAVLVFDDIAWSDGMRRAWHALEADDRIRLSLDLGSVGVCLLDPTLKNKQRWRIPIA